MTTLLPAEEVISAPQAEAYFRNLREICGDLPIFDCHVHPTEVIFDKIGYLSHDKPINAVDNKYCYQKPSVEAIGLGRDNTGPVPQQENRFAKMAISRLYRFTGAAVLRDQMSIAGVDRAVLLPVAHRHTSITRQMEIIDACNEHDQGLIPGFSIDDSVPDHEMVEHLQTAIRRHGVRVVKIHPNFSQIDLSCDLGRIRTNSILRACNEVKLPVVIHGGSSPILGDTPESNFATVENLSELDWSCIRSPVIIAHFGVYGAEGIAGEISAGAIKAVLKLADENSNIFMDTSGVSYATIYRMLQIVEPHRIVFGSDAMYVPIYRQMAQVMHALTELGMDVEIIREIVSENPMRIFD